MLATLVVVAVMAPLPALADVLPGGSVAGNSQGDFTSPGVGPTVTGLEWVVQHPQLGRSGAHSTQVIRDAQGHVVLNAYEEQPDGSGVHVLVAIDPTDGSIAWQLEEMAPACLPVASDDGFIYAYTTGGGGHTVTDLPGILEIDAADGSVVRSWEEEVTTNPADTARDDGNPPCAGGNLTSGHLTLVGDTLVFTHRRSFDRWLVAVDLSGADMTLRWEEYFDGWEGSHFPRVIASPEGDVVFFVHERGFSSDAPAVIGVFDLATGALLSTTEVVDIEHLAAVPGGLLVHDESAPQTLTRYDRVGDDLVEDWSVVWERDDTTDESGTGGWIDELAVAGDTIVSAEPGGSPLYGISLETGLPVWTHRPTPSFINNGEPKVDANGVVWYSVFGFGLSAVDSATGDLVTTTGDDPDAFFGDFRGELIAPILDDGRVIMVNTAFAAPDGDGLQLAAVSQGTARLEAETPDDVAIQICQLLFPAADTAGEILLSRNDAFPDALAGAPLATAVDGPLLLTQREVLTGSTEAEIQRVLPSGGTVYLTGGTAAIEESVADTLRGLGYTVVRASGATRYATSVEVARVADPDPAVIVVANGNDFPEALVGGALAAAEEGVQVLSNGEALDETAQAYLAEHPDVEVVAIGATAAAAVPGATAITGDTIFDTSVQVARARYGEVTGVAIASGTNFPDGLAGGAHAGRDGIPLLLSWPDVLPGSVEGYLGEVTPSRVVLYGGTAALSYQVEADAAG